MEYAIQLLLPILGGLLLGNWLQEHYGVSPIVTVVLSILGLFAGIGILYKRSLQTQIELRGQANAPQKHETDLSKNTTAMPLQHLHQLYEDLQELPPDEEDAAEPLEQFLSDSSEEKSPLSPPAETGKNPQSETKPPPPNSEKLE